MGLEGGRGFDGEAAFGHVRAQVALGPRPPGSTASAATRRYIFEQVTAHGFSTLEQPFEAATPLGPMLMTNLLARFPPGEPPGAGAVVLAAHYDTKIFDFEFVGANDGASGVACLLELARVIPGLGLPAPVVLAFLDGEEAVRAWGRGDGLYGSRFLAATWLRARRLREIRAVIVLDLVGDRELLLARDLSSTPWLQELAWSIARDLGYERYIRGPREWIEDDHLPFLMCDVPALDLIGFGHLDGELFPPYWHTPEDTLDKVHPASLKVVGDMVAGMLPRLQSP